MLTPDQLRLRLEEIGTLYPRTDGDFAVQRLTLLLQEVLPDLVALASGRSSDDAGRRYGVPEGEDR